MEWQPIAESWVLLPRQPVGIVHFLGGAFVGTAPHVAYRSLLDRLGRAGFTVVATPFLNGFDHQLLARDALNRFETVLQRLQQRDRSYLPIYGLGHSMGCKLHLLIGSIYEVERAGNILMAYNNYPVRRAIPILEQFNVDLALLEEFEFTPSPAATCELVASDYPVRRNLLIQFADDTIDQTAELAEILRDRFGELVGVRVLRGNHLTPLSPDISWQAGRDFSPVDAIAQWVKQEVSRDLQPLSREILRWLAPTASP